MKRWVIGMLVGVLVAAPPVGAVGSAKRWVRMDTAKHVAFAWARKDVRDGWAFAYSRPDCRRLSRIRIRCDLMERGTSDYDPTTCRNESPDVRDDCRQAERAYFTLYVWRSHRESRCLNLWVWDFERIDCWRFVKPPDR